MSLFDTFNENDIKLETQLSVKQDASTGDIEKIMKLYEHLCNNKNGTTQALLAMSTSATGFVDTFPNIRVTPKTLELFGAYILEKPKHLVERVKKYDPSALQALRDREITASFMGAGIINGAYQQGHRSFKLDFTQKEWCDLDYINRDHRNGLQLTIEGNIDTFTFEAMAHAETPYNATIKGNLKAIALGKAAHATFTIDGTIKHITRLAGAAFESCTFNLSDDYWMPEIQKLGTNCTYNRINKDGTLEEIT